MALPSPPFIPVAGIPNLRDIGGYPVHSPRGHLIRPGIVFRSADPSGVTPPGLTTLLTDLRVAHVYDLRSPAEATRFAAAPSPLAPIRSLIPVFPDRDYGPEAIALRFRNYASDDGTSGFVAAYRGILEAGKGSFARVLRHLAAEGDIKPLLVNCTAGKDRTGVACALVLSLCGVEDAVVAYEFGLTELGLADKRAEYLRHLQAMPLFQENPAGAERMLSARPESMLATLGLIRDEYGSVEAYVRTECGLSDEEIERIRRNMVVDASSLGDRPLPTMPYV
ncbi:hypothetical protein S40285_01842 [Stachybotrys chlorohalonatus IBT 40285]|uniref:Tyrosine specific protein phosphatases domain-containing protein n=1 Tax=Stachybotrys chlorohalonatus (strain IBT 40285) TaxID=1283841 RepID=A0A084QHF3_STAC4|nr:hypothetical protein S40285_01842 [Stachybotrys chlorohalonata IBT 40285]